MSATIVFDDQLAVGTILVGNLVRKAGCSNYPQFGKITKITPTKKYRIAFIGSKPVESARNDRGVWGSYTAIVPDETAVQEESALAHQDKHGVWSSNMHWELYDKNKEYANEFDNGD